MLLTTKEKPFDSNDFLFEFKWDGFRCIYFIEKDNLFLQSRNQNNLLPYFPELKNIINYIKAQKIILDGEICFFSKTGKLDFSILQHRLKNKKALTMAAKYPVTIIVWDILSINNHSVYQFPLYQRKKILKEIIIKENSLIQLSPFIDNKGIKLYERAKETEMEGIVAKKKDSPYEFKRSKYWLKIKIWHYTDAFIGGYTPEKTAISVGKFLDEKDYLNYMGKIRLALPREEKIALFNYLPELKSTKNIFINLSDNSNIIMVKPLIKCKVKYSEITGHNIFRHGQAVKLLI